MLSTTKKHYWALIKISRREAVVSGLRTCRRLRGRDGVEFGLGKWLPLCEKNSRTKGIV